MNAPDRLLGRLILLIFLGELLYVGSGTVANSLLFLPAAIIAAILAAVELPGLQPFARGRPGAFALLRLALAFLIPLFGGSRLLLFAAPLIPVAAGREATETGNRRLLVIAAAAPLFGGTALLLVWFAGTSSEELTFHVTAAAGAVAAASLLMRGRNGEELRRTAGLRKTLASKEAILSTLAHEVRTPVTVIKSTAEIMQEGRTGELAPMQREFLDSIASSARRLITFSENILASIKVESDWFALRPEAVDIRSIIKDVAGHMGPVLEEKRQQLRYTFPKLLSRPPADPVWIHQVLVNLVHNASKHLSSGGRIIIAVNENEQCVVVSVSDDGSGIRTAERLRVFDDYFQGDEYDESRLDGAGLGLAIVKRVVEKHAGRVYVSSVKGHGTTVSFTLPKHPVETA